MSQFLKVEGISKTYKLKGAFFKVKGYVEALKDITFDMQEGEILTVIGESGSGKSTLALIIAGLLNPDSGKVIFKGKDLLALYKNDPTMRRKIQIIFQDPYNTLNPRFRVYDTLSEPLLIHKLIPRRKIRNKVEEILGMVGLSPDYLYKYPHQLSGGERQRVAIARAMILEPELLICDEPTSNLDLSIQAQILNLLLKIKKERKLSLLFITHDISIAGFISDRIIVLYKGKIIEEGSKEEVLNSPRQEYTRTLIEASILETI